jgi:hydrogenase-4 transcriptional activator
MKPNISTVQRGSRRGTVPVVMPNANDVDAVFRTVGQKLREGLSGEAENIIVKNIGSPAFNRDKAAHLQRLLSFTLETAGRYKESLDTIKPYEEEEALAELDAETRIKVITQLAIAYNNAGDQPKAVTLLKSALADAADPKLQSVIGGVEIGLARVYRKLAEFPICRDHAQRALEHFRREGNWLGMAEAYREIANSYHQEGNSERSIDIFKQAIGIIGDNSAPFMLGKLYTDMSGAYWFLKKPKEGIACLERSIEFFDQTEHALNKVIAYNNLGIHLVLLGDWQKAEEMIKRALEIALKEGYTHVAGIYESLGELELLRGNLDEAEKLLDDAVAVAERHKHAWYTVQAMRMRARCYLSQGRFKNAAKNAEATIEKCSTIGDKHYANMARLVLAEALMQQGMLDECEDALLEIEENDPKADFFVLGTIQRIRGLSALAIDDVELAIHHFSRALTIFEAAEDTYHTGLMHFMLGSNLEERNAGRSKRHLQAAAEIFRRLGLTEYVDRSEREIRKVEDRLAKRTDDGDDRVARPVSSASQLITARLADATATRELMFRELVAVLQQESGAKRVIVAEVNKGDRFFPFITHGYSPTESNELVTKLNEARQKGEEKSFARGRGIAVYELKGASSTPALLIISPASGALLGDGGSIAPLLKVVELGLDVIALRENDHALPKEQTVRGAATSSIIPGFIHSSPAMNALVEEIYKIRSSDVTVLVTGESGTGKELVAQAIHAISNRKDKIFSPFNCTTLPKDLAEGQLFGYRRGAFTGAVADSPGVIRNAHGGTLFLDEVGDLPPEVQPKLLRFLQEGEVHPLGEKHPVKVDVRIIAATNMPLEEKVAAGTFREDLYYRLNVIRLRVPPLRERRSEIPPIVHHYVDEYARRFRKENVRFTPETIDLMMVCEWEGNVRQLQNEVQRIMARAVDNEVITPDHLSPDLRRSAKPLTPSAGEANVRTISTFAPTISPFSNIPEGGTLESAVSELEMQLIRNSLTRHNWNISRVASELGLTRRGLYLKLSRYGIEKA